MHSVGFKLQGAHPIGSQELYLSIARQIDETLKVILKLYLRARDHFT